MSRMPFGKLESMGPLDFNRHMSDAPMFSNDFGEDINEEIEEESLFLKRSVSFKAPSKENFSNNIIQFAQSDINPLFYEEISLCQDYILKVPTICKSKSLHPSLNAIEPHSLAELINN